jgi:hypothetical protein
MLPLIDREQLAVRINYLKKEILMLNSKYLTLSLANKLIWSPTLVAYSLWLLLNQLMKRNTQFKIKSPLSLLIDLKLLLHYIKSKTSQLKHPRRLLIKI